MSEVPLNQSLESNSEHHWQAGPGAEFTFRVSFFFLHSYA